MSVLGRSSVDGMADVSDPPGLHPTSDTAMISLHTNEPHAGGLAARLNWHDDR
ncbi:MAG: hypothetical protein JWN47_1342 [Frankiales bacterium]|nr:hypothetical protein [Frankiales bacterium]